MLDLSECWYADTFRNNGLNAVIYIKLSIIIYIN